MTRIHRRGPDNWTPPRPTMIQRAAVRGPILPMDAPIPKSPPGPPRPGLIFRLLRRAARGAAFPTKQKGA